MKTQMLVCYSKIIVTSIETCTLSWEKVTFIEKMHIIRDKKQQKQKKACFSQEGTYRASCLSAVQKPENNSNNNWKVQK